MSVFPDTSFLCAVYRTQDNSERADAYLARRTRPISISTLLLLEFRQSLHLQVRLHENDRSRGFGKSAADAMRVDLDEDLRRGIYEVVPVDWPAVHRLAEELSDRHTRQEGHRLADILHVATALQLDSKEFLTFDGRQRELAEAEGLRVVV